MTTKQSTKKGARKGSFSSKGKQSVAQARAADELTAARVRSILADSTNEEVKEEVARLLGEMNDWTGAGYDLTPDSSALHFISCAERMRDDAGTETLEFSAGEARKAYDRLVALADEHEPIEYKAARRVRAVYDAQREREGDKGVGCYFFMENYVDPLTTSGSDNFMLGSPREELFTLIFTRAAREWIDEPHKDPARDPWLDLLAILDRAETEECFDFEKLAAEHETRLAEIQREVKAEELAKPEPKDKTSAAWRYWKLRHIEADFRSDDMERYVSAWAEFRRFLHEFDRDNRATVTRALSLLPTLIEGYQNEIKVRTEPQRREAARRGAQTRKAKAAKKGGAE